MQPAEETPVLVGVGQILQRLEDPREAAEPLDMMISALQQAGTDCAVPALLTHTDSIYVLRGAWGYGDPGRAIAKQLGATPKETIGTPYGGNYSQACVIDAAREILAGRCSVALVVAAENGRSQRQAQRQGVSLQASEASGEPDRKIDEDKAIFHDAELARGMNSATDIFAIIESAIRKDRGESHEANMQRIAAMWSSFSTVAANNPNAWMRKPHSAQEIAETGPNNPMISYPYTRLMNANAQVDMAAGVILCSLATARSNGIPEEKLVYLHAATEANDDLFLSNRQEFHRSPAVRIAGNRLLELAEKNIEEINYFDLYSCFPSSVQVAADELSIPEDRTLTTTGGLTFGGGPLNSYTLHAVARTVEVLREHRKASALIHGNGGWLAKHALGLYSAEPPVNGFRYESVQQQVDSFPKRKALINWNGPVTIEAYTVSHRKGEPVRALVACLTDEGCRSWGTLTNPTLLNAMMHEEFCGRHGHIDGEGNLSLP